ncbi:putative D-aminoacylase [Lasiosphaeria ovina]|uniref:D-aminoacylase n=1 Tax=Lasiosphaeria ovina TaxID=92902 RepID=A0AAE0N9K1_9PEZI|nr:putative D-aminoacylase [Lasiosphaeria ovina]
MFMPSHSSSQNQRFTRFGRMVLKSQNMCSAIFFSSLQISKSIIQTLGWGSKPSALPLFQDGKMEPSLLDQLRALDGTIESICSATGSPGLSVGVAQAGSIVHTVHYGYRDVEKRLSPDSDTVYGVASLTKSFVASAMGILVDEGKVSWTTPVRSILPGLDSRDALVTEQLSVADLLIHNSGLAFSNNWWYGADGELLLQKDQTIPAFNALEQGAKFRTKYSYSNWPYCVAGEVIEKLSGETLGAFIQRRVLQPLRLARTAATHDNSDPNLAQPYAVLDDKSPFRLPFPKTGDANIMAPAQAVRSSVKDMLAYGSALLAAQKAELAGQKPPPGNPLRGTAKQLSGHISKGSNSPLRENSYGFGMDRVQLPQSIAGVGCNSMFVREMPRLVPRPGVPGGGLLLVHTGSLAGYTSMLGLLPEYNETVIFVVTNAVGLGDASGWVLQLLVDTIIGSESKTDYVALATEAATNHARREVDNAKALDEARTPGTQPRPSLDEYVGDYVGLGGLFKLQVRRRRDVRGELEVLFQGLESQAWPLTHYEHDTFSWLQPFNEQARRARFNLAGPDIFKLKFMAGEGNQGGPTGAIDRVCWMQEPGLAEEKQCLFRTTTGITSQLRL